MLDERVKKLTIADIGLVKLSVFFFTILVIKFIPFLADINTLMLVLLIIASAARPVYVFWLKK